MSDEPKVPKKRGRKPRLKPAVEPSMPIKPAPRGCTEPCQAKCPAKDGDDEMKFPVESQREACFARCPVGEVCRRPAGHGGPHEAHKDGKAHARWW